MIGADLSCSSSPSVSVQMQGSSRCAGGHSPIGNSVDELIVDMVKEGVVDTVML